MCDMRALHIGGILETRATYARLRLDPIGDAPALMETCSLWGTSPFNKKERHTVNEFISFYESGPKNI
jgi:hypothetical protein